MAQPHENLTKQIFVAYAYNLYDQRDYRKVYTSLEKAFGVKFIFADEKITNMHILQKIISYIRGSDFSLFGSVSNQVGTGYRVLNLSLPAMM